jgi:hypothetical protein
MNLHNSRVIFHEYFKRISEEISPAFRHKFFSDVKIILIFKKMRIKLSIIIKQKNK